MRISQQRTRARHYAQRAVMGAVFAAIALVTSQNASATIIYKFAGIIDSCSDCGFSIGDTFMAEIGFVDGTDTTSGMAFGTNDIEFIKLPAPFPSELLLANASGTANGIFRDEPDGRLDAVGIFQQMSFGFDNLEQLAWNVSFFQFPPFRTASGSSFTFTRVPEPATALLGVVALFGLIGTRRKSLP